MCVSLQSLPPFLLLCLSPDLSILARREREREGGREREGEGERGRGRGRDRENLYNDVLLLACREKQELIRLALGLSVKARMNAGVFFRM